MYRTQYVDSTAEINRLRQIIKQSEKDLLEADAEAARARTVARKIQEEFVVMQAHEEGRRQGYKEGLREGKQVGFEEGRAVLYAEGHEASRREYYHHEEVRRSARPSTRVPEVVVYSERPPSRSWR